MYNYYDFKSMFMPEEIVVYLRKSRSDDPTLSVEDVLSKHETILNEWISRNLSGNIPDANRYREVVSGETIADRPEIQNLLRKIESPKYKAILVVEVQRLSRGDLEDAGKLIKLLRFSKTLVITPQKTYDLDDEYDRDIFERELKRGNEFLEYQKRIMQRGTLLSVSQGNFVGSKAPYGYDKIWVMDGKRKCPTLKENKEQADIVRMIFDLYVNHNWGYQRIAMRLDELKITPPESKHWSPQSVRDLLANVHYIGKVKWNWRKTVTIVEDSEIIKTRPRARSGEYLLYDGKHEGIISEELFNAAQNKQGTNPRLKSERTLKNPLAGLIYCSCGRAMSLRFYRNKDGSERCSPRLMCDNTHCSNSSCLYDEIFERVCNTLEQTIEDFEVRIKNTPKDTTKIHANIIKNLEKKLKDIEAKELAQWEAQADPDAELRMPPEIFKKLNEKLQKEKEETKRALENAYDSIPVPVNYENKIKTFRDALQALRDPSKDTLDKNRHVKACIERIEYSRESARRLKRNPGEKKGTTLSVGGDWTKPPIELDVKLRV